MEIQFENGLVPVIVQEKRTREVLMLAYANAEALDLTRTTGYAHYYSRSRRKLWKKGEESGHFQRVCRVLVDCDADAVLYEVKQEGVACHTGHASCFYRTIEGEEIAGIVVDPEKVYANKGE
ncbi:phosphoribosyl-AMP cyclohydrolase [Methanoculleus palmolei]|jgi:phosphoribosyl-AMP cyclohydrolase|uniref:Phosphoribosyl-AMP cyclohydrolase n=1 Tax=Methanoculleus palmolei TaxID=72612 RepID=A0ABD8A941_9EURY|nr:phosphoribosyl-AMP cyclohydrolase [Methanoculleus sp. UBA377]WOX56037.1 phosphoribosyl-AMP cyclohydrolase [Methanoculleus palmolei]